MSAANGLAAQAALLRILAEAQQSTFALAVEAGRLVGRHGARRLAPGLRTLVAALQADAPVEHGCPSPSAAERALRRARRSLAEVDRELAELVLPPVVGQRQVRVRTSRPVRLAVEEEAVA